MTETVGTENSFGNPEPEPFAQPVTPTWVYAAPITRPVEQVGQPAAAAANVGGKSRGVRIAVVAGVVSGLLSGASGYVIADWARGSTNTTITLPAVAGDTSPRPDTSIAGLAKKVLPTVVSISVTSNIAAGTGSGFIIKSDSSESFILTNNHVVSGAGANAEILINFQDESEANASIVGTDESYDLAVLKISRGNLPVAQLGNSNDVVVGDATIAIGSPLGLSGTVTSGIVSAMDRPVTAGDQSASSFISAIQTDTAINPGNSGGPLINARGQVIGVNSAIASLGSTFGGQSGSIGLGFAIPINQAKRVAEELMSTGKSTHPIIGVSIDMTYSGIGARIGEITAGGPAEKSGLKSGDIVTKVSGKRIADGTELIVRIRARETGETVTLTLSDNSTVDVVLGSGGQ